MTSPRLARESCSLPTRGARKYSSRSDARGASPDDWYGRWAVLGRTLDDSFPAAIRRDVTTIAVARLSGHALYRYIGPFIAVVAAGSTSRSPNSASP